MSFLKKVSTSVARAKQVAMVKIGQSDSTVDPQFNQLETQFKEQYNKIKKFGKYVEKYQAAVKDIGNAQKGISAMVLDQYDSSDGMYQIATHFNENIVGQIEAARIRMEQHFNESFHLPLNQYLGQYKIIEERINERNTRLVDMDRYNADLKLLMSRPETDPPKLQIAKEKCEYKTREYTTLNDELIHDIPLLLQDRSRFFDILFANIAQGKYQYFAEAAKSMGLLTPNLAQVKRTGASSWPFVITDPARSAHKGGSAGAAMSSQGAGAPPGQPQRAPMQPQGGTPQGGMRQPQPVASQGMPQGAPQRTMAPPQAGMGQGAPAGGQKAKALYPFQGQDNTEISFQPGQVITIISQSGEWWVGEVNGQRGYFPASYAQLM